MSSTVLSRPPVLAVLQQHMDDAVALRHVRSVQVRAPHVELDRLRRLDDRLAAHLDGLVLGGDHSVRLLQAGLESPSAGLAFALGVLALVRRDAALTTHLAALAAQLPDVRRGFVSSLGWVSAEDLQGVVRALLGSRVGAHRVWGLQACAMHKVDPGAILAQAVQDGDPQVRAGAWRVAGQLGRRDLTEAARRAILEAASVPQGSPQDVCAVSQAARALTLWGHGQEPSVAAALLSVKDASGLPTLDAHRLATLAHPLAWSREDIRALSARVAGEPQCMRRMIRLVGWAGDPQAIPWVLHQMADARWARLAGESFSLITGADLSVLDLERKDDARADAGGPTDDPDQDEVGLDEDESLPWPDVPRVQAWWQAHAARFTAGQAWIAGQVPDAAACLTVLRTGGQRQRVVAAERLCLMQPSGPLFPVAAPAWRQSRWLAALSSSGA